MNGQLLKVIADTHYKGDMDAARKFLASSKPILDCVAVALEKRLVSLDKGVTDYEIPSWAFKQAHYNGKREMLEEVLALVEVSG